MTKSFPTEEKFGLISQLRRASTSISANIAEGMSRDAKEKLRFLQIAYGSLMEVLNFLIISYNLQFITEDKYLQIRMQIQELTNKINAFYKNLKN